MFLPGLAVVFGGIVGGNAGPLDKQIKAVIVDVHVKPAAIPAAQLRTLTHHGDGTREIVKRMHVEGVIGFEVVTGHTLRVVIYDGDGGLKTYSETPLNGLQLDKDDLDVLRMNIAADVRALTHAKVDDANEIEMDPTEAPAPVPAPVRKAPPVEHAATPVTTAAADDSVSADDIEAMTGGGGDPPVDEVHVAASASTDPGLRMGVAVGLGVASRSFSPSAPAVLGYSSSPVGAIHFDANVQPTTNVTIGVVAETTLGMTTPLHDSVAATTISRWEATASYTVVRGIVDVAPLVGLGRRSFSIDSTDPSRSPDGDYNYLILGATAAKSLGSRVLLRGILAFEPVVSGADPTAMAFGSASRWALDVGAGVEVRPRSHVFMRATADYQRFTWSSDMAGSRGSGGAVDGYPSATLALGAEY